MPGTQGAAPPFDEPFFYPLTTVIALTPFTALPIAISVGAFFAISSFALAFFITRDALWRVHIFASAPFVVAAAVAQFSPLLTVAALVPWAGALCAVKPNLGIAVLLKRPTVAALVSCGLFGLVSVAIAPHWLFDWLHNLRSESTAAHVHEIPLLQTGGILLLAALLAIKREDGRLLLAMSAVPQALFFYDQLPLLLVAQSRQQSIFLTACSQASMLAWWLLAKPGDSVVRSAYPMVMTLIYLPVLGVLLLNTKRALRSPSTRPESEETPLRQS